MESKKVFEKRKGNLIYFGESEDTSDLVGIVVGYNDKGCILAVTHGSGDYQLKPTDIVPDEPDRYNEQGYLLNDLEYIHNKFQMGFWPARSLPHLDKPKVPSGIGPP